MPDFEGSRFMENASVVRVHDEPGHGEPSDDRSASLHPQRTTWALHRKKRKDHENRPDEPVSNRVAAGK
jgi:hypothetical protein